MTFDDIDTRYPACCGERANTGAARKLLHRRSPSRRLQSYQSLPPTSASKGRFECRGCPTPSRRRGSPSGGQPTAVGPADVNHP